MTPALPRTIRLFGELDIRSARELQATLSEAVGDRTRELAIDLRKVTFIDSTALGALVRASEQLRNQGRMLTLALMPGGAVEGLLDVSGLYDRFTLVSELPDSASGSTPDPAAAA
ncbi:MAG: STAS domain-containing protein [Solirubrobacteraceae bacterium]